MLKPPNLLFCDAEPRLKWEFTEPLILGREACPDTNEMAELTIAAPLVIYREAYKYAGTQHPLFA